MAFVSVTRLRIRRYRFMPGFAVHTLRSLHQVRRAEGLLGGSLLTDARLAFWTMTVWRDQAAMRRYMTNGAHLKAMPHLLHWCDEASIVHWTSDAPDVPSWPEAERRMRSEGRPSKVRHPSVDHHALRFAPPRRSTGGPIRPVRTRTSG